MWSKNLKVVYLDSQILKWGPFPGKEEERNYLKDDIPADYLEGFVDKIPWKIYDVKEL